MKLRDLMAPRAGRRTLNLAADASAEFILPLPDHSCGLSAELPVTDAPRPSHLKIALRILYQAADGQVSEHAVIVHRPISTIGASGTLTPDGFTGFCATCQSQQTFCRDRIVEARDALTGVVIDNLETYLAASTQA